MHYRQLGRHDATVSEISFGCNRLGEAHSPDAHWDDLVQQAMDLGVTLFDTAEAYGWGRSEELLGAAIGNRSDILIASKVSRVQESNEKDFSAARIVAQAEASLRRLQRDCIDIYQLHSPTVADLQQFDWPEAMHQLKAAGKTVFAISHDDHYFDQADRLLKMDGGLLHELHGEHRVRASRNALLEIGGAAHS